MKIMRCLTFIFMLAGTIFGLNGFAQEAATDKPIPTVVSKGTIKGAINDIKFSPDSKLLAVATSEGTRIYDVVTRHEVAHFTGHKGKVNTVAFSANGTYLASGGDDKMIHIWNVKTEKHVRSFERHTSEVSVLVFTSNNTLTSGANRDFIQWNIDTGQPDHTSAGNKFKEVMNQQIDGTGTSESIISKTVFTALGLSLNGEFIARARVLEVTKFYVGQEKLPPSYEKIEIFLSTPNTEGNQRSIPTEHIGLINALVFSPDGKYLASGSADKTICLHDTNTGELLYRFKGHEDSITALTYYPLVGIVLTSGSTDGTIRTWNTFNKRPLRIYSGHTEKVTALAYSPDGTLVSGSKDGTVLIWKEPTSK